MKHHYVLPFLLFSLFALGASAQEVCNNGVDDDADGLVDLNDETDCMCQPMVVVTDGLVPNGSFEDHTCLPSSWSQLDCAEGWQQGTFIDADYYHMQGFFPSTAIPTPLPGGGEGCVGGFIVRDYPSFGQNFLEYPSICLPSSLAAGASYTFEASVAGVLSNPLVNASYPVNYGPVDITLFGNPSCGPTLATSECPSAFYPSWVELGHVSYQATGSWGQVSFTFVPDQEINGIMFGGPCDPPMDLSYQWDDSIPYFYYDEVDLIGQVTATITGTGHLCTEDLVLSVAPVPADNALQWYFNGVALVGETTSTLDVSALGTGPGIYQFTGTLDPTCSVASFTVLPPVYPAPTIALVGDGLFCAEPGPYQWFLDGSEIMGATQALYTPTENDSYQVETTNGEGCSTLSGPFDLFNVGLADTSGPHWMLVTAAGSDLLEVRGATSPFQFELFDAAGRHLASARGTAGSWNFPVGALPHGLYVLRLGGQPMRWVH